MSLALRTGGDWPDHFGLKRSGRAHVSPTSPTFLLSSIRPAMSTLTVLLVMLAKALAVVLFLLLGRGIIWIINMLYVAPPFDVLRKLPGPRGKMFQEHLHKVMDPNTTSGTYADWVKMYGKTFSFHGFGSVSSSPYVFLS